MMTDLVERLRNYDESGSTFHDAIAEIERLQAENERLNKQIATMNHAAHAYEGSLEDSLKRQELLEKALTEISRDTNE